MTRYMTANSEVLEPVGEGDLPVVIKLDTAITTVGMVRSLLDSAGIPPSEMPDTMSIERVEVSLLVDHDGSVSIEDIERR